MVIPDFLHDRATWEWSIACVSSASSQDEGLLECRLGRDFALAVFGTELQVPSKTCLFGHSTQVLLNISTL